MIFCKNLFRAFLVLFHYIFNIFKTGPLDARDLFFILCVKRIHFRKDVAEFLLSEIELNKCPDVMISARYYHENNTGSNATPEGRSQVNNHFLSSSNKKISGERSESAIYRKERL